MKQVGFVNNIFKKGWKQLLTVVLNYEELLDKPVLGAFLFVKDGQRHLLARVESAYYAPVLVDNYSQPLAMGAMNNRETDESTLRSVNFMHYDLALLGEIELEGGRFLAGVRNVPSLLDAKVYAPDKEELQKVVAAKIPSEEENEKPFKIGALQYGTSDAYTPAGIEIRFDSANLWPKRTAVFGKTGYGKSNLIKTLISVMNRYDNYTGQLIFDVNGEYGFEDAGTGKGLIDVFRESGDKDRLVIYTNRQVRNEYRSFVRPIKFNVYDEPQLAAQLRQARIEQEGRSVPQYIHYYAETDEDVLEQPYKETWWYGCSKLKFQYPHESNDRDSLFNGRSRYSVKTNEKWRNENSGEERIYGMSNIIPYLQWRNTNPGKKGSDEGAKVRSAMRDYFGQFRFLGRLHTPDQGVNVFDSVKADVEAGKVVIVDLSSVEPAVMDIISSKIAGNLFYSAQDKFLEVLEDESKRVKTLIFIEEAHNLLSKEQRATIFKRIAREGRKYGIGLVYSTQRPGSIEDDILAMTENFFAMHVSSEEDAKELKKAKIAFDSPISDFILSEPAVGVSFVYSEPYQPYVLSCRVDKFEDILSNIGAEASERQPVS